jgi:uncharacterized membrane protein YgdD (TMEM256/DUF423 family)
MKPNFTSIGAASAAIGVALGAFGAHALRGKIPQTGLAVWETGTRYWLVGALGLLAFGSFQEKRRAGPLSPLPGWLLALGSVLFTGSLCALALGAPRAVGAITPLGGICLISGFLSFAWAARRP